MSLIIGVFKRCTSIINRRFFYTYYRDKKWSVLEFCIIGANFDGKNLSADAVRVSHVFSIC